MIFLLFLDAAIRKFREQLREDLQLWVCTFCCSVGITQPDSLLSATIIHISFILFFYISKINSVLPQTSCLPSDGFSNPSCGGKEKLIKSRRLTRSFGFCSAGSTVKLVTERSITSRMESTKTMSSWRFSCRMPLVT